MTFKIAAQENLLEGDNLIEKFRFAQEAGFDGIELQGLGNHEFPARLPELRAARAAGVEIPSVCVNTLHFIGDFDPERRREAREHMKELLSTIADIGGKGAVTPNTYAHASLAMPPWSLPKSDEEIRETLVEGLAELGAYAVDVGATVYLEPLNRYEDFAVNTLADAVSIVEEVGSPGVEVMADIFQLTIEEIDIPAAIRAAAPHLRHVHVSDSNGMEPGAGSYDWRSTLDALRDIEYDGWLALECHLSGDPMMALSRAVEVLRR